MAAHANLQYFSPDHQPLDGAVQLTRGRRAAFPISTVHLLSKHGARQSAPSAWADARDGLMLIAAKKKLLSLLPLVGGDEGGHMLIAPLNAAAKCSRDAERADRLDENSRGGRRA